MKLLVRSAGVVVGLVEFGSGTSTKTRHLLTHVQKINSYIPIDISGPQLFDSAAQLATDFPHLEINPLEADYTQIPHLPSTSRKPKQTVAFFPGSTIGNFEPAAATSFLRNIARLCGRDGGLLIGVDRKKRNISWSPPTMTAKESGRPPST